MKAFPAAATLQAESPTGTSAIAVIVLSWGPGVRRMVLFLLWVVKPPLGIPVISDSLSAARSTANPASRTFCGDRIRQ
eukprot:5882654-Alexandrium_andersonii.AAC.1